MTLEEIVFSLWRDENPRIKSITYWGADFAEADFDSKTFSQGIAPSDGERMIKTIEEVISTRLVEGLTSNNKYIRRYAQLLSEEEDNDS